MIIIKQVLEYNFFDSLKYFFGLVEAGINISITIGRARSTIQI